MNISSQFRWNILIGPIVFGLLYYIFLLINYENDPLIQQKRFDIDSGDIFGDAGNYFTICFVIISASAMDYIFERVYDFFFNHAVVLMRNRKFRDGMLIFLRQFFLKKYYFLVKNCLGPQILIRPAI